MRRRGISLAVVLVASVAVAGAASQDYLNEQYGELLPGSTLVGANDDSPVLWWASSGWKIGRDRALPAATGEAILIAAARNEAEAAQLVVRPSRTLKGLRIAVGPLAGPNRASIAAGSIEVLEVRYVNVTIPTDKTAVAGYWPDPLPPLTGPIDLAPADQPLSA